MRAPARSSVLIAWPRYAQVQAARRVATTESPAGAARALASARLLAVLTNGRTCSGSWVEIVEVGMVGSGFIKTGAVLSWEGVQYCGTPGFKVR